MQQAQATAVRWWQALDTPVYLISVLPGATVWLLTGSAGQLLVSVSLATLAVILLQHAINVLNDVSDWRLGADQEKYHSWARFHHLNLRVAAYHGYASLLAGAVLGLAVLIQSDRLWILFVALPMVLLGYLYNAGPRPLSYTWLGEWVTGLCYGPGVFGCLWLLAAGHASSPMVAGSLAFFALATALLLSHQPPQIETDRQAGKHTFAVRYGAAATRRTSQGLFIVFLLAFLTAAGQTGMSLTGFLASVLCAALASGFLLRVQPSPRRILTGASAVILVALVVEQAAHRLLTG
jgi:1,4-dihydroxy-2-naphthoate octaprenyltransferase